MQGDHVRRTCCEVKCEAGKRLCGVGVKFDAHLVVSRAQCVGHTVATETTERHPRIVDEVVYLGVLNHSF